VPISSITPRALNINIGSNENGVDKGTSQEAEKSIDYRRLSDVNKGQRAPVLDAMIREHLPYIANRP
jgi:hypothetical protein